MHSPVLVTEKLIIVICLYTLEKWDRNTLHDSARSLESEGSVDPLDPVLPRSVFSISSVKIVK